MSDPKIEGFELEKGFRGMAKDTGSDQTMFKGVHWGKAMMWIFLLSDTFVFSCFLIAYMKGRASTPVEWPNPSEVFALDAFGVPVPLLLIALMTFVLITSSGTMALAVKYGYERNRKMCGYLILATALGGLTFVGMQAYEWSKLIHEGVRPWENPFGAPQFGSFFFMITGFHGTHVSIGVIFLFIYAYKVFAGHYENGGKRGWFTTMRGDYVEIEILGLYWHFVDLVWVFIFAFFYLW